MENNKSQKPLVAVWSLVYNHEPYLRDYFEGIIMQKTNFPFIAIVHDDCSTDGSAAIIKEYAEKYPDIIKPIFETENQYSKKDGSLDRVMHEAINASGAKYIALCEGDDYWIDPLKLQKQIDFLENNSDYGLCYTNSIAFKSSEGEAIYEMNTGYETFDDLIVFNSITTLTVVVRTDLLKDYYTEIEPYTSDWLMGDYPRWLYCALKTKIKFLNIKTAAYRILPNSASHFSDTESYKWLKFRENTIEIQQFFIHHYNYENRKQIRLSTFRNALSILERRTKIDGTMKRYLDTFVINSKELSASQRLTILFLNQKGINSILNCFYKNNIFKSKLKKLIFG